MDREEVKERIRILLDPEPGEDVFRPPASAHPRITDYHRLDGSYVMGESGHEERSTHPHWRYCPPDEGRLLSLIQHWGVALRLFEGGLRLYGDSIVAYHGKTERKGEIRYYPATVMVFWSGFETYVRCFSELMLATVRDVPQLVADHLLEREAYLDDRGEECCGIRWRPILERYAVLLKYGYGFAVDRGNKHWQSLVGAKKLRDYYAHVNVRQPRAVSSQEVLDYVEAVMLALIWPSCELRRTLLLGIYRLYNIWAELAELQTDYVEQPRLKDWVPNGGYSFHCNFENVDTSRFPSDEERRKRLRREDSRA